MRYISSCLAGFQGCCWEIDIPLESLPLYVSWNFLSSQFFFFSGSLSQSFSMYPWLSWNLLDRPRWPWIQRVGCLCRSSAELKVCATLIGFSYSFWYRSLLCNFDILIIMCRGDMLLWSCLNRVLKDCYVWMSVYCISRVMKRFAIILLNRLTMPLSQRLSPRIWIGALNTS